MTPAAATAANLLTRDEDRSDRPRGNFRVAHDEPQQAAARGLHDPSAVYGDLKPMGFEFGQRGA